MSPVCGRSSFLLLAALGVPAPPGFSQATDLWTVHVEPLLKARCISCHGGVKQKSELDLRSPRSILEGGKRGPAVVPGKPQESRLFRYVQAGADPHMPPAGKQLSGEEIAVLASWIRSLQATGSPVEALAPREGDDAAASAPSTPVEARWRPPPGVTPRLVIDLLIEKGWHERNLRPGAPASDRDLVRRLTLDLAGRIPTPEETEAFLADTRSDKRERLVDRLLASEEYGRHMAEVFDVVLMGRDDGAARERRRSNGWFAYLEGGFRDNRPWNDVAGELLLARPRGEKDRASVWFLYERRGKAQDIAEAVAPAFFGVQVQCAQCHDHPIAPEIEQAHYWGLVSFFNRSQSVDTAAGPGVAESAVGGFTRFATLSGDNRDASLVFLDGQMVDEARPAEGKKPADAPEKYLVPPPPKGKKASAAAVPKFSRRARLVDIAARDNPLLARSFVNRIWALLLGRGLVHPVDKIDSAHPPSHPELLEWLSEDFRRSGHDVKRLVGEIAKSRVYQLDSRGGSAAARLEPAAFALALEKPLSAEALYRSMLVATDNWPLDPETEKRLHGPFASTFPQVFHEEYGATLAQALFLTNNAVVDEMLDSRAGGLLERLLGIESAEQRVEAIFHRTFGRRPDAAELQRGTEYLGARAERPKTALKQLLWAVVTSAEFRFNH